MIEKLLNALDVDTQDSREFRKLSVKRTYEFVNTLFDELKNIPKITSLAVLQVILDKIDDLDMVVLNIDKHDQANLYSDDVTIQISIGNFPIPFWKPPVNKDKIYIDLNENLAHLVEQEKISLEDLAKKLYLMQIILHRYENGNGRTARLIKLIIDKLVVVHKGKREVSISEEEIEKALGVDKKDMDKIVANNQVATININMSPDFHNLMQIAAEFVQEFFKQYNWSKQSLEMSGGEQKLFPEKVFDVMLNDLVELISPNENQNVDILRQVFNFVKKSLNQIVTNNQTVGQMLVFIDGIIDDPSSAQYFLIAQAIGVLINDYKDVFKEQLKRSFVEFAILKFDQSKCAFPI